MFDIGSMELLVIAVVALVVVGPRELPSLLRSIGALMRKMRALTREFRQGLDDLAREVEEETDPFSDLKREEGLRPGMSPEEITEHILANHEKKKAAEAANTETGNSDSPSHTDPPLDDGNGDR